MLAERYHSISNNNLLYFMLQFHRLCCPNFKTFVVSSSKIVLSHIYTFETLITGLATCPHKNCPTVSSTVSILADNLSCWSNKISDTSDSLSVIALSTMDASELAASISCVCLKVTLSKLWSSSMQCLTGFMRKLIMSQRTFLGRSTAGCTILYLMREMNAKILHASMHNILLSSLHMYMADARQ